MSYCHYWGTPAELGAKQFELFSAECKQLRAGLGFPFLGLFGGVKIGDANGRGQPIFQNDIVCFNGKPYHESFLVRRVFQHQEREVSDYGLYWNFVNTNRKPYDTLVVASLLSLHYHFDEAALYSDGGESDWSLGIDLYEKVTRRKTPPLSELVKPRVQLSNRAVPK